MSDLKLRLLSFSPAHAEGARLPALLALVLATGVAVQFALPQPALPDDVAPGRAPDWRLPDVTPLPALQLAGKSLFSPLRIGAVTALAEGTQPQVGPLEGAFVLGTMRSGGGRAVLLRDAERRVFRLPAGGSYKGWRLIGIAEEAARFRNGTASVTIPFGSAAPAQASEADSSSESDE